MNCSNYLPECDSSLSLLDVSWLISLLLFPDEMKKKQLKKQILLAELNQG